jgi:uncharacterized Ntn-hydrolase superfamily protein
MMRGMTWSILARDPASGAFGVAVATKSFAVGAICPFGEGRVGVVGTQALVNPLYGPDALRLMRTGVPAPEAAKQLLAGDEGREHRQLHMLDAQGRIAQHTGSACIDWCGHLSDRGVSVAGNMLAGPRVIAETAAAYHDQAALPFPRRLIAAMRAGEAAGGDKRGRQSAALKIYGTEIWAELDLRVDDHAEPLAELARLEAVSRERFVHFRNSFPTRANPSGIFDRAKIEAAIAAALAADKR